MYFNEFDLNNCLKRNHCAGIIERLANERSKEKLFGTHSSCICSDEVEQTKVVNLIMQSENYHQSVVTGMEVRYFEDSAVTSLQACRLCKVSVSS